MLEDLKNAGFTILLATSKPEPYSILILEHYGIDGYFDGIAGASMDDTRTTKDEVIAYALTLVPDADPADMVMVGDRRLDVFGAEKHGIPCIGALYGYGSREELLEAGAAALAESPAEVAEIVKNHSF